jgi:hypothetical protein
MCRGVQGKQGRKVNERQAIGNAAEAWSAEELGEKTDVSERERVDVGERGEGSTGGSVEIGSSVEGLSLT